MASLFTISKSRIFICFFFSNLHDFSANTQFQIHIEINTSVVGVYQANNNNQSLLPGTFTPGNYDNISFEISNIFVGFNQGLYQNSTYAMRGSHNIILGLGIVTSYQISNNNDTPDGDYIPKGGIFMNNSGKYLEVRGTALFSTRYTGGPRIPYRFWIPGITIYKSYLNARDINCLCWASNTVLLSNGETLLERGDIIAMPISIPSDYRLKENFKKLDHDYIYSFIKNITPMEYNYKYTETKKIGFLANEFCEDDYAKKFNFVEKATREIIPTRIKTKLKKNDDSYFLIVTESSTEKFVEFQNKFIELESNYFGKTSSIQYTEGIQENTVLNCFVRNNIYKFHEITVLEYIDENQVKIKYDEWMNEGQQELEIDVEGYYVDDLLHLNMKELPTLILAGTQKMISQVEKQENIISQLENENNLLLTEISNLENEISQYMNLENELQEILQQLESTNFAT